MRTFSGEKSPIDIPLRVNIAIGLCVICLSLVILRLWYLQVLKGEFFRERSENNRLSTVYVPAPRGQITDRAGIPLVSNRQSINVELVQEDSPNPKETIARLASILDLPATELIEKSQYTRKRRRFEPRLLLKDVSRDTLALVAARRYQLPGVIVNVEPTRDYLHGDFAAHILGYIREITKDQLESPRYAGYRLGDIVGQFGLESRWEPLLQGQRGVQKVIVNARGIRIGESSFEPEVGGSTVTLTIDYETQKAADEVLKDKKGAVIAMDPRTGEILAMSSAPRFDPNMFTREINPEQWRDLQSPSKKKLNNRATQGGYPPGSVFKVMMAAAALAEGVIGPNDRIFCPGFLRFGSRNYRCHKKAGHGAVDMREAMVQSCDVYFYTVGQRLGVDRIHDYALRFGLGRPTQVDLGEEVSGIIPSTEWKRRYFRDPENQKWYPGETLSVAIGQGAVVTTPLQITRAIAALVNGGRLLKPYLVKGITATEGSFDDDQFVTEEQGKLDIDPAILNRIRESMVGVVNAPNGTGKRSQIPTRPDIVVAGKTGTAQVAALEHGDKEQFKDHAWYTAYAPADNPSIVVTALIENGGSGGAVAAPLVRQVLEAYFRVSAGNTATPQVRIPIAPAEEITD
jgi:penicillin-binding protein 2